MGRIKKLKKAWLGLGGNVGDVVLTLQQVLNSLSQIDAIKLIKVSSFYKTPPWGKTDQAYFVNLCCAIETDLTPEALLQTCLKLEEKFGRVRHEKWGPRTIDIDLLAYESIDHYLSKSLTLPHPFLTERSFVLRPLCEIAPELMIKGVAVKEWNQRVQDSDIVVLPTQYQQEISFIANISSDE